MLSRQVFRSLRAAAPQRAFAAVPARTFAAAASADVKAPIAVFGLDGTYATALVRLLRKSHKSCPDISNGKVANCVLLFLYKVPMLQTSKNWQRRKKKHHDENANPCVNLVHRGLQDFHPRCRRQGARQAGLHRREGLQAGCHPLRPYSDPRRPICHRGRARQAGRCQRSHPQELPRHPRREQPTGSPERRY